MDFINMNFFSRLWWVDNIQFWTYTESKKLEDLNGVDSFFMWWIPWWIWTGKNWRAKSCDIKNKNYFVLDFDVREAYMSRTWEKLSDEDLMKKWGDIKDLLDKDSFYKEWSYFVFTWNWFHVYYIWKSRYINPEVHTFALKYIHKKCDEITNNPDFKVDPSLKNIARYSRVPWSYNFKRKEKHWLDPAEVYIMHEKDIESRLFNNLEEISKRYLEKIKKDQQLNIVHRDYWSSSNVIDAIQNINVWDIFSSHTKHRFADNWKNFLSNKSWLLWCFYDKENNLLIKDGTEHINSDYEWYSPFLYVRAEVKWYWWSKNSKFDSKVNEEVFQRFEDNYPHISSLAKESRKEFAKAQEEKEKNKDLWDIIVDKNNADWEYHWMLYTTWLNIITETVGHIWDNESAIVHWPSKHGKTTYTLSMANENWRRWVKVAYFSL